MGQVVINLGTLNVGDVPFQQDLNGASIPAGTYTSASLTTEWLAGPGNPWSNESIWALTDGFDLGTSTFFVDPGIAPNSAGNGDAVTLEWNNAFFDIAYSGGSPLVFNALQTFESLAQLNGFLLEAGYELNGGDTAEGAIQGSAAQLLEQSSTRADRLTWAFADGEAEIRSCYYEFAKRYETPDGALFDGFVPTSADTIFESTDR